MESCGQAEYGRLGFVESNETSSTNHSVLQCTSPINHTVDPIGNQDFESIRGESVINDYLMVHRECKSFLRHYR